MIIIGIIAIIVVLVILFLILKKILGKNRMSYEEDNEDEEIDMPYSIYPNFEESQSEPSKKTKKSKGKRFK